MLRMVLMTFALLKKLWPNKHLSLFPDFFQSCYVCTISIFSKQVFPQKHFTILHYKIVCLQNHLQQFLRNCSTCRSVVKKDVLTWCICFESFVFSFLPTYWHFINIKIAFLARIPWMAWRCIHIIWQMDGWMGNKTQKNPWTRLVYNQTWDTWSYQGAWYWYFILHRELST